MNSSTPLITGTDFITVPTKDFEASAAFYRDVLGLQESILVAMADGYARASGKPGVVGLHTTMGSANGWSMVYNAYRDGSPLVVTAGHKETGVLARDGFSATPDLEGLEVDRQEATRRLRAWHKEADHERQRREAELVDRWYEGTVSVDGFTVPARLLTHDETDVGVAWFDLEGDGVLVVAEGIDLDAIRLAGVADPEPLIHEFEVRQRRAFPGATA
jgi:catechol 2,3-dioxygenase-like lactoylglutathione lyase family enzyme